MVLADIGLQDGVGLDDVFWFVAGIGTTVTVVGVLLRPIIRRMRSFGSWLEKFQRDWDGEAAEPGRDRVPGVMERLNQIDGELQRNGGSSLKDAVCRMQECVETIVTQVQTIESRQREIAARLDEHSRTLDDHVAGPGRTGYDPGRERI